MIIDENPLHQSVIDVVDATKGARLPMRLIHTAEVFAGGGYVKLANMMRAAADALMRETYTPPAGFRLVAVPRSAHDRQLGPAHYLSGPMTGLPDLNYPAFHAAAAALRSIGINVVSPAEIAEASADWASCMRADLAALCGCDAVILMPGWETSQGAHLELHIAHRIGLRILYLRDLLPDPQPYDRGERAHARPGSNPPPTHAKPPPPPNPPRPTQMTPNAADADPQPYDKGERAHVAQVASDAVIPPGGV